MHRRRRLRLSMQAGGCRSTAVHAAPLDPSLMPPCLKPTPPPETAPLRAAELAQRAPRPGARVKSDSKVSILLVDDRADKLLAVEAILAPLEQNVVKARSGKEALRH